MPENLGVLLGNGKIADEAQQVSAVPVDLELAIVVEVESLTNSRYNNIKKAYKNAFLSQEIIDLIEGTQNGIAVTYVQVDKNSGKTARKNDTKGAGTRRITIFLNDGKNKIKNNKFELPAECSWRRGHFSLCSR